MNPKKSPVALLLLSALALCVAALSGCASWGAGETESLLSAAGFRSQSPNTQKQWALYNNLPAFQMERHQTKTGKVLYAYADKKSELVYIGNQAAYDRYQKLNVQQNIADEQVMAASMNEEAAMDWDDWGPLWW